MTPKKTVIVVEDNQGLRDQLLQILDSAADIRCAGAFVSRRDRTAGNPQEEARRRAHGHQAARDVGHPMSRRLKSPASNPGYHGHRL